MFKQMFIAGDKTGMNDLLSVHCLDEDNSQVDGILILGVMTCYDDEYLQAVRKSDHRELFALFKTD